MKKFLSGIIFVILVMTAISVAPALALTHSPPNCNADNSVVNIARSKSVASVGDTITFTVSAGNPTSFNGCDIIGRTMTLTLPNGTTKVFGPYDYPNPSVVVIIGSADYVAKVADVVGGVWTAKVDWVGTQLDGSNSPSSGHKETPVTYIQPLQIIKTAVPAIQQTYTWTINKSVTPAALTLNNGDTGTSNYTVAVVKSLSGTVYTVSGTISIHNPNPIDANISNVSDTITGIGEVSVSCPVSFPYTLTAGADLSCTYSSNLPDTTARTNTATVTTTGDVGGGSGTANIDFSEVTPTVIGGSINVDDTYNGGTWAFSDSGSVNYPRTFDCSDLTYDESGHASYCKTNTATIRGTALSDDATVCVDCYRPPQPVPAPSTSPFVMIFLISVLAIVGLTKGTYNRRLDKS